MIRLGSFSDRMHTMTNWGLSGSHPGLMILVMITRSESFFVFVNECTLTSAILSVFDFATRKTGVSWNSDLLTSSFHNFAPKVCYSADIETWNKLHWPSPPTARLSNNTIPRSKTWSCWQRMAWCFPHSNGQFLRDTHEVCLPMWNLLVLPARKIHRPQCNTTVTAASTAFSFCLSGLFFHKLPQFSLGSS